jgi:hypothetical protein
MFCCIYAGRELLREIQKEGKCMQRMVKAKIGVWKTKGGKR